MEQRFVRNLPTISAEQQRILREKHAVIIGCGGLGGYIAEFLARAGVGKLTFVDGDAFEESNLNRQTLALPENLGENKAVAAAKRVKAIDGAISLRSFPEYFCAENAEEILAGADIVMDGLDSVGARLLLEEKCAEKGLWIAHGAVAGWCVQCCLVPPGSGLLGRLYAGATGDGGKSVLSPVPPMCAALQCSEALKKLCADDCALEGRVLSVDLFSMDFDTFSL